MLLLNDVMLLYDIITLQYESLSYDIIMSLHYDIKTPLHYDMIMLHFDIISV